MNVTEGLEYASVSDIVLIYLKPCRLIQIESCRFIRFSLSLSFLCIPFGKKNELEVICFAWTIYTFICSVWESPRKRETLFKIVRIPMVYCELSNRANWERIFIITSNLSSPISLNSKNGVEDTVWIVAVNWLCRPIIPSSLMLNAGDRSCLSVILIQCVKIILKSLN